MPSRQRNVSPAPITVPTLLSKPHPAFFSDRSAPSTSARQCSGYL